MRGKKQGHMRDIKREGEKSYESHVHFSLREWKNPGERGGERDETALLSDLV